MPDTWASLPFVAYFTQLVHNHAAHAASLSSSDWAAIGAVAAAVIALLALLLTAIGVKASRDQTKIQRQLREDAAQPYVWADVRIDDAQGVMLALVVGNSGPTIATNVKISIDPPFPHIPELARAAEAQERLARGLRSLPPGRVLHYWLGQGYSLLEGDEPKVHRITITADGPFGAVPALTYDLDLAEFNHQSGLAKGNLHLLTQAVKGLQIVVQQQPVAANENWPDEL
jgi:hypothetical protein